MKTLITHNITIIYTNGRQSFKLVYNKLRIFRRNPGSEKVVYTCFSEYRPQNLLDYLIRCHTTTSIQSIRL